VKRLKVSNAIDVGCGLGYSLEVLSKIRIDAVGIDASNTAVEYCRKRGMRVTRKLLEDEKKRYDLVFSDGLLEHFLNFSDYVTHLGRISKKYIIIAQTDHEVPITRLLLLLESLIRPGMNMYEYNFRMKDYITAFANHGFNIKLTEGVFFNGFKFLVFEREEIL
jgi:2-polyprenyl-3-methyl-5-hydroxy-6-metoxy-1,4-benzoquinol methylase